MNQLSINELKQTQQWAMLGTLHLEEHLNGKGHFFYTLLVFGMLIVGSGLVMFMNSISGAIWILGVGIMWLTLVSTLSLPHYLKIINKTKIILESDKDSKVFIRARHLLEFYHPDEARKINWNAVKDYYKTDSTVSSWAIQLIKGYEWLYLSQESKPGRGI